MSFGWEYPPGVSGRDIDRYFGGDDVCDPCHDGEHEDCEGPLCECRECAEVRREDHEESVAEERRLARKYQD